MENHPDDASSIKTALKVTCSHEIDEYIKEILSFQIYSLISIYFGIFEQHVDKMCKEVEAIKSAFKNKLIGKRKHPRFVIIKRIAVQIEVLI